MAFGAIIGAEVIRIEDNQREKKWITQWVAERINSS